MSATLKDFTAAIRARLETLTGAGAALEGVALLIEDAPELELKINAAIEETGALMLIGRASFSNKGDARHAAHQELRSEIAVGENPLLWRTNGKPTCDQIADQVVGALQGFAITGFAPLEILDGHPVPDKERQLFEIIVRSSRIIQKTT